MRARPKVAAFAEAMDGRLRDHEDKGGWEDETALWLHNRLKEKVVELGDTIADKKSTHAKILKISADVANYAMMIADVRGALKL